MSDPKRILVTGATGKVGQTFIHRLLADPAYDSLWFAPCATTANRSERRLEIVRGSIEHRQTVENALEGVTHVVHLATCKETPEQIMDVAVKGLFWLLETCRASPTFQQFILIGGDAGVGHFVYPHPIPVTETQKHRAYPGCYALSKVLEEVMLEQYYIQYDLNGCCLRAPWIMEKDDFKYQLSFGEDVFGGPRWRDLVGAQQADEYVRSADRSRSCSTRMGSRSNAISCTSTTWSARSCCRSTTPRARQQTFNICMDEPVDYGEVAAYLAESRGLPSVDIPTPYHSTWLDNTKAKFLLGWRPEYDLKKMIDAPGITSARKTIRGWSGIRVRFFTCQTVSVSNRPSITATISRCQSALT